jgi:hypothetical protein
MGNNIGDSNNNNNGNRQQIQTNCWVWLAAYLVIGLAVSFVVPFPLSFGIALLVFFALNAVRMHIALKKQGMIGGIKDLYKSMSSSLGNSWNNSGGLGMGMGYSPIKFYCMNCRYEHKENTCPKCGSKAVRVA